MVLLSSSDTRDPPIYRLLVWKSRISSYEHDDGEWNGELILDVQVATQSIISPFLLLSTHRSHRISTLVIYDFTKYIYMVSPVYI